MRVRKGWLWYALWYGSSLRPDDRIEGRGRVLLHRRDDVRVEIEGDRDRDVAEHLGDDLRMHASAEQDRRGRVTEVVEADPLEARA